MTTAAFVGRTYLERGDGGSPETYTRVCQTFGMSGIGQTNDQIEATNFCSGGSKEYIAGLADGAEVTFELNFETAAQVIRDMIADVQAKATRAFRVVCDDDDDDIANFSFYFVGTCISWVFNPSATDRNTINFTVKISGAITIV